MHRLTTVRGIHLKTGDVAAATTLVCPSTVGIGVSMCMIPVASSYSLHVVSCEK